MATKRRKGDASEEDQRGRVGESYGREREKCSGDDFLFSHHVLCTIQDVAFFVFTNYRKPEL